MSTTDATTCQRRLRRGSMRRTCGGKMVRRVTRRGRTLHLPGSRYQPCECEACGTEAELHIKIAETLPNATSHPSQR